MKNTTIALNGTWRLLGEDEQGVGIDIPIQIPGYVHPALEKVGILPEMFYRDNASKCQWPEKKTWIFQREFKVEESRILENVYLEFDSVDTFADIFLNGQLVYHTSNMFVPFSVKVDDAIKHGTNVLRVVIYPWSMFVQEKLKGQEDREVAFGTVERSFIRRIQCTFYWDWVERFVSAGICRNVKLSFEKKAHIVSVMAATTAVSCDFANVAIRLNTKDAVKNHCTFSINILSPENEVVWAEHGRVYLPTVFMQAGIRKPQLWWPLGYGEQPLYRVEFQLYDETGSEIDQQVIRIGIRTVCLETLRDLPGSREEEQSKELLGLEGQKLKRDYTGESFALIVNGKRIHAKGGNWVPPNPFPDGSDTYNKHVRNLLELSAKANLNCIRVWGGGVYETDEFYDACDELGIIITQDFMLSCGDYPEEDEEFVKSFAEEVKANVLRLRNHACIAFWSANNENSAIYDWDDPKTTDISLIEDVYLPILDSLDPYRTFRMCSPYGGCTNDDVTVGDNHSGYWWTGAENITPDCFDKIGRFQSESPFGGYLLPYSLMKFLAQEDINDPNSEIVEYHIKNNSYFTEVLHWPSVHGRLKANTEVLLGLSNSHQENLYRYAYIQYEWARFAMEAARRNKWYNAALQFWMYNDCWPAVGYAIVDFYGKPKAGWYSLLRSCAPIAASIVEKDAKLECWCLNDGNESAKLTARLIKADMLTGNVCEIASAEIVSLANENQIIKFGDEIIADVETNCIMFLELYKNGIRIDRARWYRRWLSDVDCSDADIDWEINKEANTITVRCISGIAIGVALDGDFVVDNNFVDLFPGEKITLHYDGSVDGLVLYAYNRKE